MVEVQIYLTDLRYLIPGLFRASHRKGTLRCRNLPSAAGLEVWHVLLLSSLIRGEENLAYFSLHATWWTPDFDQIGRHRFERRSEIQVYIQ